jgi:hypothetical protein
LFWAWKSRRRIGRPTVSADVRALIRTMSHANSLWGAPRIHGELLKLGVNVSQATVAKYMTRRRRPPSQTWRTFLANHLGQIAAADFFVVPTATCRLLFVLVILAHERRRVVHVAITDHPTAAVTAQQLRSVSSCSLRAHLDSTRCQLCRNPFENYVWANNGRRMVFSARTAATARRCGHFSSPDDRCSQTRSPLWIRGLRPTKTVCMVPPLFRRARTRSTRAANP